MGKIRKPFQGVWNIIRFNWHFYVLALLAVIVVMLAERYAGEKFRVYIDVLYVLILWTTGVTLLVSFYVYDLSGLYRFDWLDELTEEKGANIVNINAGFDETSVLLKDRFPFSEMHVLDFYDPTVHTEISIKRARNAYPPYPRTIPVKTTNLPLANHFANKIFLIFAAHEIRNDDERAAFFREISRVLKADGQIVVTEHLRDIANFMAYNIGFFHFYSKASWLHTFQKAGLTVKNEKRITPFIITFILEKNGNSL